MRKLIEGIVAFRRGLRPDYRETLSAGWPARHAAEDFCYLTTVGRRTGNPHEIEIWFAVLDGTLYMMAGGRERADWVRNVVKNAEVRVRIKDDVHAGTARVIVAASEPELDARVRRVVSEKYGEVEASGDLSGWGKSALAVEVRFPD